MCPERHWPGPRKAGALPASGQRKHRHLYSEKGCSEHVHGTQNHSILMTPTLKTSNLRLLGKGECLGTRGLRTPAPPSIQHQRAREQLPQPLASRKDGLAIHLVGKKKKQGAALLQTQPCHLIAQWGLLPLETHPTHRTTSGPAAKGRARLTSHAHALVSYTHTWH